MYKAPEFWYVALLALSVVFYVLRCFQFFNTPGESSLATLFFGYVIFTVLISRFLVVRWQQNAVNPAFSWTSLFLFLLGLLPALLTGLGYWQMRLHIG